MSAQSLNWALNAGDTAHVTCAGPSLTVANQTATALDLTCAPNPSPSPSPTPVGAVSEDRVAKVLGAGTVAVNVTNTVPEVVVAWVSADDSTAGQAITVSGGGLTWTLAGRSNTQRGDAEAWWAITKGSTFTTTATPAQGGKSTQLTVITYAGSAGIGAVKAAAAASGAPTATLTPQATGSMVGAVGMDFDRAVLRTIGAGQTMDAQDTDAAGDTYWVQHVNATTTAGTATTVNDTAPTTDRWDYLALEVTPGGAPSPTPSPSPTPGAGPVIDASTPTAVQVPNNVTSITSSTFTPPASTVLYAVFSVESYPNVPNNVTSVTNSGTPLTWTMLGREAHTNGSTVGGFVEVWWAYNPTAQTGINVTATFAQPTKNVPAPVGAFEVLVMRNAAANQAAAAWTPSWLIDSTGTTLSAAVTTTAANSLVLGAFDNWDSADNPTPGGGQSVQSIVLNATDQDAYWLQAYNVPTATSGAVTTVNATVPTPIHWHELAWEVLSN